MKNIIAVIGTKGGIGKTKISTQILPVAFAQAKFENWELIEMDNNNQTSKSLAKSELLKDRFKTLNLKQSEEELENIVSELELFDQNKKFIFDVGGGDDTRVFLKLLKKENLIEKTLFILPYMADFEALQNLEDTIKLVQNNDFFIILNNIELDSTNHSIFTRGNEEMGVESMKNKFGDYLFVCPSSPYFSFSVAKFKWTAWDGAGLARKYGREEFFVTQEGETKESVRANYRRWKQSKEILTYFKQKEIEEFIQAVQIKMGLA